jgi:hypothetical protein
LLTEGVTTAHGSLGSRELLQQRYETHLDKVLLKADAHQARFDQRYMKRFVRQFF